MRQLIEALNRRVPHVERVGEAEIARDAAGLMKKALERLKALERSDQIDAARASAWSDGS